MESSRDLVLDFSNDNDISATTSDEEDLEEKIKNSSTILLSEVSGYEDSYSDIDARKK